MTPENNQHETGSGCPMPTCSLVDFIESLPDRAAEWSHFGEGRADPYRAGYADAIEKLNQELVRFKHIERENVAMRKRMGEHDGCSRWGVDDMIALKSLANAQDDSRVLSR